MKLGDVSHNTSLGDNEHRTESSGFQQSAIDGQAIQLPTVALESTVTQDIERPDTDWREHPACLAVAVLYCYAVCLTITTFVYSVNDDSSIAPMITLYGWGPYIGISFFILYCMILSSLAIESTFSGGKRLIIAQAFNFGIFFCTWLIFFLLYGGGYGPGVSQFLGNGTLNIFAYAFGSMVIYISGILMQRFVSLLRRDSH